MFYYICKDTFNQQGLGFRASCILNMHIFACMHFKYACITDYLEIHCTPCSMTLIAQRPRPPPVTCTICTPPQDQLHSYQGLHLWPGPNWLLRNKLLMYLKTTGRVHYQLIIWLPLFFSIHLIQTCNNHNPTMIINSKIITKRKKNKDVMFDRHVVQMSLVLRDSLHFSWNHFIVIVTAGQKEKTLIKCNKNIIYPSYIPLLSTKMK